MWTSLSLMHRDQHFCLTDCIWEVNGGTRRPKSWKADAVYTQYQLIIKLIILAMPPRPQTCELILIHTFKRVPVKSSTGQLGNSCHSKNTKHLQIAEAFRGRSQELKYSEFPLIPLKAFSIPVLAKSFNTQCTDRCETFRQLECPGAQEEVIFKWIHWLKGCIRTLSCRQTQTWASEDKNMLVLYQV